MKESHIASSDSIADQFRSSRKRTQKQKYLSQSQQSQQSSQSQSMSNQSENNFQIELIQKKTPQQRNQHWRRNKKRYKYHQYQIVWAKVTGYPWWPGKVTSIQQAEPLKNTRSNQFKNKRHVKLYGIYFLDNSVAYLQTDKLRPYYYGVEPPEDPNKMSLSWKNTKDQYDRQFKKAYQQLQNLKSYQGKQVQQKKNSKNKSSTKNIQLRSDKKLSPVYKTDNNAIEKSSQAMVSRRRRSNKQPQSQQIKSRNNQQLNVPHQKEIYIKTLLDKGIQRRKCMQIATKVLSKSTPFSFNICQKLSHKQILQLLKQKSPKNLQQMFLL